MQEVVYRRYRDYEDLPSLVVIDGGKGQLSSALEVIRGLGLDDLPVVGLAKREEEIFKPHQSESIMLDREGAALHLIQRIRDEAHRFAITGMRAKRAKTRNASKLEDFEGIGPKRRAKLLTHFGGMRQLSNASAEDIAKVPGISKALAERIYAQLHNRPAPVAPAANTARRNHSESCSSSRPSSSTSRWSLPGPALRCSLL